MKKVLLTISVLLNLVLIMGANFPVKKAEAKAKKAASCGYTIVEFGKAVDCNGDTIQLVKRNGMQMRAMN